MKAAARNNGVPESAIVSCAQVSEDLPTNADIEDLFDVKDYLRLYNWAFDTDLQEQALPTTAEPILRRLESVVGKFDHALPAHALTEHRKEFFANVEPRTLEHFEKLFQALNGTIW